LTQFLAGVALVAGFIGALGRLIVVRHDNDRANWDGWMWFGKLMELQDPSF
jgi:hypothetical protein